MSDILTQHGRWPTRRGEILMGLSSKARPKNLSDIPGLRYWNDAYICATTQFENNNAVDIVVKFTKLTESPYALTAQEFSELTGQFGHSFCEPFLGEVLNCKDVLDSHLLSRVSVRSISAKKRGPSSYETEIVVAETHLIDTGDFPDGKRQPHHIAGTLPYLATDRNLLHSEVLYESHAIKGWHCLRCRAGYFATPNEISYRSLVPHEVGCAVLEVQERVDFLEKSQPELAKVRA